MKNIILEKPYLLLARKNVSRVSLFTTAIITMIMMRIDAQLAGFGGKGAFYLQVAFTKSNFTDILSSWRSGGVDLLVSMIWLNYFNAVSYAVLFASAMAFFSEARRSLTGEAVRKSDLAVIVVPFVAALSDWISTTLLYQLFTARSLAEGLIMASSVIFTMKWVLMAICLVVILKSYFSFRKAMKGGASKAS